LRPDGNACCFRGAWGGSDECSGSSGKVGSIMPQL